MEDSNSRRLLFSAGEKGAKSFEEAFKEDFEGPKDMEEHEELLKRNFKEVTLVSFQGNQRFKSIRRAIRRGLVSPSGEVYPKRPYNNRKNRVQNELKKQIHGQLKEYAGRKADD